MTKNTVVLKGILKYTYSTKWWCLFALEYRICKILKTEKCDFYIVFFLGGGGWGVGKRLLTTLISQLMNATRKQRFVINLIFDLKPRICHKLKHQQCSYVLCTFEIDILSSYRHTHSYWSNCKCSEKYFIHF